MTHTQSPLCCWPRRRRAPAYVLAHGAGAGMSTHYEAVARELAQRGIATLRYQFPYWSRGQTARPPKLRSDGSSRGGQAAGSCPPFPHRRRQILRRPPHDVAGAGCLRVAGVRGLVFLGFTLHPGGRPSEERAVHLSSRGGDRCLYRARATGSTTLASRGLMEGWGREHRCVVAGDDHSFPRGRRARCRGQA